MRASLRNNYQHCEYGSLDYTAQHVVHQHLQYEDHHQHLIQPNLLPYNNQILVQHNEQLTQVEQVNTFTASHHLIEPNSCYSDNLSSSQLSATSTQEQLIVYENGNHYQVLGAQPTDQSLNNSNEESSGEVAAERSVEDSFRPTTDSSDAVDPDQTYHTVFYEPLLEDSCPVIPEQHHNNCLDVASAQFATHLIATNFTHAQHQYRASNTYSQFQNPDEQHEQVANEERSTQVSIPISAQQQSYQESHQSLSNNNHSIELESYQLHVNSFNEISNLGQHFHLSDTNNSFSNNNNHLVVNHNQQFEQLDLIKNQSYSSCHVDSEFTNITTSTSHSAQDLESYSPSRSTSSSKESWASTLTRDEKKAREASIPLTYYEIVNLSIEHFNEQLAKHNLTESQLSLIKDIRRRGKNKVAAQSCRKRKLEQISKLQHEVNNLALKKKSLHCERQQLIKEHDSLVQEHDRLYAILQSIMQPKVYS